jgi:hypothetical protein
VAGEDAVDTVAMGIFRSGAPAFMAIALLIASPT